ncbi:hypothetical protein [Ruegeria arenilitoris]|uniref:hypothetical protein n=1 Tax=Ruegeria arenilitoris TaxID=1173585 RepID=UPI00147F53BE|nr:hypothetical protein [Ruegeria arenilitoris]
MPTPKTSLRVSVAAIAAAMLAPASSLLAGECDVVDFLDQFTTSGTFPAGAECSAFTTSLATTGTSCFWSHPYRSTLALDHASELWATLTKCRVGRQMGQDDQVNHPDSYNLKEWVHEEDVYAVSVKDKGGQNRTFVFLRVEPGQQPSKN